ncbi:MAG: DUF58 domain-containing protein [Micromonosporaceae bacterium]
MTGPDASAGAAGSQQPGAAMVRPTGAGAATLLGSVTLLAAGLWLGYSTLTGLGMAGLVALLLAVGFVLASARLKITRTVSPDRVFVGERAYGHLTVTNLGRLTAPRVDAIDHLDGAPLPVPTPAVKSRGEQVVAYPIELVRRGLVTVGPVVLQRQDPLGLLRRSARLAGESTLWAHPRVHRLRPLPVGVAPDFEGRLADQAPRGSTAFSSLREYEPGDDPRQIHWRSTARLGKLVVREHVDTNEPATAIVLDTRADVLAEGAFEAAVELAASVAVASGRVGHTVTLSAVGEDLEAVRHAGGHSLLDRLAALRRTTSDKAPLIRLVERAAPGGCLVVVSGDEPGLLTRLAAQRRRFNRVVVLFFGSQASADATPDTFAASGPRGHPGAGAENRARITRRPGLAVLRAETAADAVAAWNQLARPRSR